MEALRSTSMNQVDLKLVSVDVSRRWMTMEQSLLRGGYLEALRSPAFIRAIRQGFFGQRRGGAVLSKCPPSRVRNAHAGNIDLPLALTH